jgi:hypothetical protein
MELNPKVQEVRRTLYVVAKSWGFTDSEARRLAFWAWLADRRGETNQRMSTTAITGSAPAPRAR